MTAKKTGLGKGLDSLITDKVSTRERVKKTKEETAEKEQQTVNINLVEPNRDQPRKNFDEDSLVELSESIKQFGVLQPLLVMKKDNYYEIIAGERRWRAAKLAGLKEVPIIVKQLTDQEKMEISLIENIQRENLNPIEEALAFKRLIEEFSLKQDELAERVSKSRTAVTNSMRLLKLDERVQKMVIDEMLSTGHARALLGITDAELQYTTAQEVFDRKLSVRETEALVKKIIKDKEDSLKKKNKKISEQLQIIYKDLEEQLKKMLGTKVSIDYKNEKSGKLEIEYYSQDELNRIIEILKMGQQ